MVWLVHWQIVELESLTSSVNRRSCMVEGRLWWGWGRRIQNWWRYVNWLLSSCCCGNLGLVSSNFVVEEINSVRHENVVSCDSVLDEVSGLLEA